MTGGPTHVVEQSSVRVVVETVIPTATADTVYGAVSDVSRMAEWSPEGRGVPGDGWSPTVGTRFSGSNRNGWHRWSTTCTVAVADPGREFAFDVTHTGLQVSRWSYQLEQHGDDVLVRETWTDARGSLMKLLGIVGTGVRDRSGHNARTMSATLDAMRAALSGA